MQYKGLFEVLHYGYNLRVLLLIHMAIAKFPKCLGIVILMMMFDPLTDF